ncbi:hypothetical protein BJ322DRAFT_1216584 [Thelephora terrestris]|uniref:DUF6532 domain-containing protein n=1 Tax=Thelephora terrestris TaxID=56493 RepID=A0A9P6HNS3_9AGAM|nr:hypothetical protein BJ322DRAFT_1216584 [Thelephora terrestris]
MSSVSRNTRSRTNPTASSQNTQNSTAKTSGTDTTRQEAVEKATAEREAVIEELVDTEAQIAAKRAANLRSLARPLPNDSQARLVGNTGDESGHSRDRGPADSVLRGSGSRGNHRRGRGTLGLGQGISHGPKKATGRDGDESGDGSEQGNAMGDSTSRILPDIQGLPTVPAMNVDLNGTDAPENPGEKSVSKRGRVGAGEREKETRGRTGMRDEVAERLRLRTNGPQVVRRDSPTSEDDPAPITVSKRKKPPPPPTISAAKRQRLGDSLSKMPIFGAATAVIETTLATALATTSGGNRSTCEDHIINKRLSSSQRALSAAQRRAQPITLAVRHESPMAAKTTTPRPATSHILEDHTEDTGDSASDTDDRGITPGGTTAPRKCAKPKSTRGRTRGDLPKRYNTPPDTRFDDRFLPEVQYLYGLEPDPWSRLSVSLVQRARDKVFTEFQDTLSTKSAVFRNAKASISTWRRALLKKANRIVDTYFADEERFATTSDIAHQARYLLGDGKVIPWLFENGPDVTKVDDVLSTGYYRSTFIIGTLALHFERSSTRPTTTHIHPAGALVLTLTALERTLKSWVTGKCVAPSGDFSSANCKVDTQVWMKGVGSFSVSRWKRLLTAVEDLSSSTDMAPGPSTAGTGPSPTYDPRTQAPPSSGSFLSLLFYPVFESPVDVENDPKQTE